MILDGTSRRNTRRSIRSSELNRSSSRNLKRANHQQPNHRKLVLDIKGSHSLRRSFKPKSVNEGIDLLDDSKLIAITDKAQRNIKTYMIPSTSHDIFTHDGKLFYDDNNEEHQITLSDKFGVNLAVPIIVPSF